MTRRFAGPAGPARTAALVTLPVLLSLAGCAGIRPAQMALPAPLAAAAPTPVQGLGPGRSGHFTVGSERGSFTRGRDRLEIFSVLAFDRASTRYTLTRADGTQLAAACRGRQDTVSVGVLQGRSRPFTFECEWQGGGSADTPAARLSLAAPSRMPGTRAERQGSFTMGGRTLELRSVHQVQGSPLPLDEPIGYVLSHQGQPVGAIELNGTTPRLWRPAAGDAHAEAVTLAALALALLWDPAGAA